MVVNSASAAGSTATATSTAATTATTMASSLMATSPGHIVVEPMDLSTPQRFNKRTRERNSPRDEIRNCKFRAINENSSGTPCENENGNEDGGNVIGIDENEDENENEDNEEFDVFNNEAMENPEVMENTNSTTNVDPMPGSRNVNIEKNIPRDIITVECIKLNGKQFNGTVNI